LSPLDVEKSVILLGAGASCPAGVPMAYEMTDRMLGMFGNGALQRHYLQTARAIIGALQMASGVRSEDSASAIDIELVVNAAKLLGARFDTELSPFVGAWHQFLDRLERTYICIPFEDIEKISPDPGLEIAQRLSRGSDGALFRNLVTVLTAKLNHLSWLTDSTRTAYLNPLLEKARTSRLIIATLNYDNTVEISAKALNIPCSTLGDWQISGTLPEPSEGVDLLKLHGSINWKWLNRSVASAGTTPPRAIREVSAGDMPAQLKNAKWYDNSSYTGDSLGVLFGGGNKLTAEGPFMDLFYKFKRLLWEREHLLVIGYSFRDDHINHIIDHWLTNKQNARISIVEGPKADIKRHRFCLRHEDKIGKYLFYNNSGVQEVLRKCCG